MDRHGGYDPAGRGGRLAAAARGCRRADRRGVGQPPDRARARRAARGTSRTTTFRPRIGTALWLGDRGALHGARHRARRAPARARRRATATGGGGRRGTATSWWSAAGTAHGVALEAPRTVRGPVGRAQGAGRRARWRRPTCRCRRSAGPASSAGSPSRRTCTCRCCCCPPPSSPPRSATSSTATSASPPCTPTASAAPAPPTAVRPPSTTYGRRAAPCEAQASRSTVRLAR